MPESRLRDLARRIQAVAVPHISYSQVAEFMRHVDAHINAVAFAEEAASREASLETRLERLEKLMGHICPDKSNDI